MFENNIFGGQFVSDTIFGDNLVSGNGNGGVVRDEWIFTTTGVKNPNRRYVILPQRVIEKSTIAKPQILT